MNTYRIAMPATFYLDVLADDYDGARTRAAEIAEEVQDVEFVPHGEPDQLIGRNARCWIDMPPCTEAMTCADTDDDEAPGCAR